MGLEKGRTSTTRLGVKHFRIAIEADKPAPGFEAVEVENPQTKEKLTKYYNFFESVSGYIADIKWYDTKDKYKERFLGFVLVIVDEEGEEFELDLPFNRPPYRAFVKFAENIDYSKPVSLHAGKSNKDGKDTTTFFAKQDGNWIKHRYTIEHPGDCPPPEDDGLGKLDFRKQQVWLKRRIEEVLAPQIRRIAAEREAPAPRSEAAAALAAQAPYEEEPMDDYPPF